MGANRMELAERTHRKWLRFIQRLPAHRLLNGLVVYEPEPDAAADPLRPVTVADLEARLAANQELLDVARPHLEWLSLTLADVPYLITLGDREAVVLDVVSSSAQTAPDLEVVPGSAWRGHGGDKPPAPPAMALALDRPVAVISTREMFAPHRGAVWTAAPVHGAAGDVIGVIHASTSLRHGVPWRLLAIAHIARVIESEMACRKATKGAESLNVLARMSSFMAHELLNPLSALAMSLSLLAQSRSVEMTSQLIARCQRLTDRMVEIAGNLRELGGSRHAAWEDVDLRALVDELLEMRAVPEHFRIVVEALNGRPPLTVHANRRLLLQALNNLMLNAIQAMPAGGTIGIRLEDTGPGRVITVWDEGPGVPPPYRARLFQEAFTTRASGAGLGLLLVKAIVANVHEGRVSYSPRQPRGSEFRIELPRPDAGRRQTG